MGEAKSRLPKVAIVGRPNVGKSTLFNRLIRRRQAIVQDLPGITRDRIYADSEWMGRSFTLVDTGGLLPREEEGFARAVNRQVYEAIKQASVVLFVVDGRQGPTPLDEDLAPILRRAGVPVLLAVNKIDHPKHFPTVQEFYALGMGEPFGVSAEHGSGTGDLLDAIVDALPDAGEIPGDAGEGGPEEALGSRNNPIRVAVLGRPNVGKSSLVNRLLGDERVIVSDIPGTTRDAIDTPLVIDGRHFSLIDTAGLRRKSRVKDPVEFYSTVRAMNALNRAHLAILLLDSTEMVTEQDKNIGVRIEEAGRGVIVAVNKWDLAPEGDDAVEHARWQIARQMPNLHFAPVHFISALTGRGVSRLPGAMVKVAERHGARIATGALNRAISDAVFANQPPAVGTRRLKIRYATQVKTHPPTFLLFVNDPKLAPPAYRRYLERRLREALDLEGTPVRFVLRPTRQRPGGS